MASDSFLPNVRFFAAKEREAGVACEACGKEVVLGASVAMCPKCGSVHHEDCWREGGCRSYNCVPSTVALGTGKAVSIRITNEALSDAVPSQPPSPSRGGIDGLRRRWNRASIWAFVISLVGIPLFGIVTGFVAMILACVALVSHRSNQRGIVLASLAMLIGLAEIVGWAVGLSYYTGGQTLVSFSEMRMDLDGLEDLPPPIAQAMRANVVINVRHGLTEAGSGSGIVVRCDDSVCYVVTNRHVVDNNYSDRTTSPPDDLSKMGTLTVESIDDFQAPAAVEWVAPNGIDLALISTKLPREGVKEARWNLLQKPLIGDAVFAIGNPHGLGWTHTAGNLSQLRRQRKGEIDIRILQTSAAINSGNSGGGLYDSRGNLIGVNTMTAQKQIAEGLAFSIAWETLIDLIPERFGLRRSNLSDAKTPASSETPQ